MPNKSLRIAWIGAGPSLRETGGAPGVATEILCGLTALGHRIDCFFPSSGRTLPPRFDDVENLTFVWGTSEWRWNRWYSSSPVTAFISGLIARSLGSLRLRREIARRHAREPYDLIFQFSNIETLAMPSTLRRTVPLVIHPATHIAGELRSLVAERQLSLRCQPRYVFAGMVALMSVRAVVQRIRIQHASLLVCISRVFRDHLVHDYGYPLEKTVIIPNPVRLERFTDLEPEPTHPPTILVLGRIAARKGLEDVVAVARTLLARNADVRVRVVGGPSLTSDYTKLLDDLPHENAEYAGRVPPAEIPQELARCDVLLQASKFEPFALTVAEALAAGVPIVATSEVGAIENVDRSVVTEVAPGDVAAMADALIATLERKSADPVQMRSMARAEAERLFAPAVVCEQLSAVLEQLVERSESAASPV